MSWGNVIIEIEQDFINIPNFEEALSVETKKDVGLPVDEEEIEDVLKKIKDGSVLVTDYGKKCMLKWIKNKQKRNKEHVLALNIGDYPKICLKVHDFFIAGISDYKFEAPKILLDIIKECSTTHVSNQIFNEGISNTNIALSDLEVDAIEYLGGYTLKKASTKFPAQVNFLKSDSPHGKLIPLMEKKQGVLCYPSEILLDFLKCCFKQALNESKKTPQEVNFNNLCDIVIKGQRFQNLVYYLNDLSLQNCHAILIYVTKLFLKVLSYTLAKKLFVNYMGDSVACGSKGIRDTLKQKSNKF